MPGYEVVGEEERQAINEIFDLNGGILFAHSFDAIRNGIYRVREFEAAFAKKIKVPYAQAVSSCTAALKVALDAMGVCTGDEVIIPSFTFVATVEAVIQTGARPVIVDIDDTLNIDPASFERAITEKTRAVIPVHMFGAAADMNAIMTIAKNHNILVLEDAAQACGAMYKGNFLGTIGNMGAYSFDAGKVIITGEGGMVVTKNKDLYIKARAYHDHGHEYSETKGRGEESAISEGFNFRMTELQGAIGLVQLGKLDMIIKRQRENKAKIMDIIKELPFKFRKILDPEGEIGDAIVFYLKSRKDTVRFVKGLQKEGLGTKNVPDAMRWHFAKHWQHMFDKYGWYKETYQMQWKKSADILERAVALPIMVKMPDEKIEEIGEKILRIAKEI